MRHLITAAILLLAIPAPADTIVGRNFSGTTVGLALADRYESCNFSQLSPLWFDAQSRWIGRPVFALSDFTPRTFVGCNFTNAKPPRNAILENCNTTLLRTGVADGWTTQALAGRVVIWPETKTIILGRYVDGEYQYKPTTFDIRERSRHPRAMLWDRYQDILTKKDAAEAEVDE